MNKERLLKYTFYDRNGIMDETFHFLDCFDQAKYLLLRKYTYNVETYFYDDINITYEINKERNTHDVFPDNMNINDDLFKIDKVKVDNLGYFDVIKAHVDRDEIVIFETFFDLVYPFTWYDEKARGEHNNHYCIIVDYDDDNYYFIDSPYVLEPKRNKVYSENKVISIISHQKLHKAFEKLCRLFVLNLNINKLNKKHNEQLLIKKIVKNYNSEFIYEDNKAIIYIGKVAYDRLKRSMLTKEYEYLHKTFFENHWHVHLILARHILLKRCFSKNAVLKENNNNVINQLDCVIKLWDMIKLKVLKKHIRPYQNYKEKLINNIIEVCKEEEKLIMLLSDLIICKY